MSARASASGLVLVVVGCSRAPAVDNGGAIDDRARAKGEAGDVRAVDARVGRTSQVPSPPALFRPPLSPAAREHRLEGPHGVDLFYEPGVGILRSTVVYLHAMCGSPSHFALTLEDTLPAGAWLVAPEANRSCGGGAMWKGDGKELGALIDASLDRGQSIDARARLDASSPRLLIGFSQGAAAALRVAKSAPGRYPALLLVGMQIDATPSELRAAGIRRIALAAGENDAARSSMQALANRLEAGGFPVRFISLGDAGHWIPLDGNERLREPVAWLYEAL